MDVIAVLGGPCCIPFDISAAAAVLKPRVDAALNVIRTIRNSGNAQVLLMVTGSAKSSFVPARKRRRDGTVVGPTTPTMSHGEYLRTALASAVLEAGFGIGEAPAAVQKILLDDGCTDLLAMAHASLNVARTHAKRRVNANEGAGTIKLTVVISEFALARARAAFDSVADCATDVRSHIKIEYVAGIKVPAAALPHAPGGSSAGTLLQWERCEEALLRNWLPLRCELHKHLSLQPERPSSPNAWLALVQRTESAAHEAIALLSGGIPSHDDANAAGDLESGDEMARDTIQCLPCGCDPSTMLCMHDKVYAVAGKSDPSMPPSRDQISLLPQCKESLSDSTSCCPYGCDPRTMLCLHSGGSRGDAQRRSDRCDAAQGWRDESARRVRQCGCDDSMLCLHRFHRGKGEE